MKDIGREDGVWKRCGKQWPRRRRPNRCGRHAVPRTGRIRALAHTHRGSDHRATELRNEPADRPGPLRRHYARRQRALSTALCPIPLVFLLAWPASEISSVRLHSTHGRGTRLQGDPHTSSLGYTRASATPLRLVYPRALPSPSFA